MATPTPLPTSRPDWYADPSDPRLIRYWDGQGWTGHTLPKPEGWGASGSSDQLPWWQTWWAVVPGLILCLPFGLVGLWRRPALALWLRIAVTASTVALYGAVVVTDTGTTGATDEAGRAPDPAAGAVAQSPTSTPTPTDQAPTQATEPPMSTMPAVAGLPRKQAEKALAAAGLVVREVRQVPSAQPRGTVLRQAKKPGASVVPGTAVVLVVAAPYPRVPSVLGIAEAKAVGLLEAAGFAVKVTTETRTAGPDGVVLQQTPAEFERAKPESTVTIIVSSVVQPVAPAPAPAQNCTPGYRPCLPPASDYDCAGGSGNGPEYASGPVYVTGADPYDLDADGDGVACDW